MNSLVFDYIFALTGAGISKASGIPTFQEHPEIKRKLDVAYKKKYPLEFNNAYKTLIENVSGKEPNDAHKALAEYGIPIFTMNIDGLHQKAGSKIVYEMHGNAEKNNIVLYGEPIHYYNTIFSLLDKQPSDKKICIMVIGTSLQTMLANDIIEYAMYKGNFYIHYINSDAEHKVRDFLEKHYKKERSV